MSEQTVDKAELRQIVIDLYEKREFNPCWYANDVENYTDCANWDSCEPGCPIVKLREIAGIVGNEDGDVPPM